MLSLVLGLCAQPAFAHNGPPFPIISDQTVGPVVLSLWTHPDVGTGTFFVLINPQRGKELPRDLKFSIGVTPVSGRLAEVVYPMWVEKNRTQPEFKNELQFDQDKDLESAADSDQCGRQRRGNGASGSYTTGLWTMGFVAVCLRLRLAVGFCGSK